MAQKNEVKKAFDRKEVAARLGVSVVTVDRELAKNRMPHFRIGRRVLFNDELLDEYVKANTQRK